MAEPRVGEPAGWVQLTSERERRADDPPMIGELADWGNDEAQFITERCQSLEHFERIDEAHGGRLGWEHGPPEDLRAALAAVWDAVSPHDPDGRAVHDFELHLNGERAMWHRPEPW
jgi:hypothetical protein